eukprot:145554-Prorocentrum_minimum.AAC.1
MSPTGRVGDQSRRPMSPTGRVGNQSRRPMSPTGRVGDQSRRPMSLTGRVGNRSRSQVRTSMGSFLSSQEQKNRPTLKMVEERLAHITMLP